MFAWTAIIYRKVTLTYAILTGVFVFIGMVN